MVLQRQYNLRRWNNAMTECISLIQSAGFLNQTIYKPEHAAETPTTTALSLLSPRPRTRRNAPCFSLALLFLRLTGYSPPSHQNMSPTTCQNISE